MENIVQLQTQDQSLLVARLILRDVYLIVRSIQHTVTFLLRVAAVGAAITDSLVASIASPAVDEN